MTLTNLKICGITSRETACFCASKGVGALGAVFYEKSPRYVTPAQARAFFNELPLQIARVGVFVDLPPTTMIAIAREAQLNTLQLHGEESSETLHALMQTPYRIIKVLKSTGEKLLKQATTLPPQVGILLECGQGTLPGGNGSVWDWAGAAPLVPLRPFALAGGLTPENILDALLLSKASACDISSGVESAPGVKDHLAIEQLINRMDPRQVKAPQFWHPSN